MGYAFRNIDTQTYLHRKITDNSFVWARNRDSDLQLVVIADELLVPEPENCETTEIRNRTVIGSMLIVTNLPEGLDDIELVKDAERLQLPTYSH